MQLLIQRPPIIQRASQSLAQQVQEQEDLHILTQKDVFLKRCESEFPEADHSELTATFAELLELMGQKEES